MNLVGTLLVGICMTLVGQTSFNQPEPATADSSTPDKNVVIPNASQPLSTLIDVNLRVSKSRFRIGEPIEVEFTVSNRTASIVQLDVPLGNLTGKLPEGYPLEGLGLPMEHVFSGEDFKALTLATEEDPYLGERVYRAPKRTIPPVQLAPFATVGIKFDLTRFYPLVRHDGRYQMQWKPYGGVIQSPVVTFEVHPDRQVLIETDAGRLTLNLLYDKAPKTVDRFVTLVERRFYDGLSFFYVDPASFVASGCPNNDGTGRAPDGITIDPEFNDVEFIRGTVAMSLARLPGGKVDAKSASSQFFVSLNRNALFDGRNTAFAQIDGPDSMATLDRIANSPRGPDGRPIKPVIIRTAVVVEGAVRARP